MNIDAILDGLGDNQQRELLARLAYKFEKADARFTALDDYTWQALTDALGELAPRIGMVKFIAGLGKSGRAAYTRFVKTIASYVDAGCMSKPTMTNRMAIMRTLFGCLVADMRGWRSDDGSSIPVSARTVIYNVDKLTLAVERSFPGYHASRLLHMVIAAGDYMDEAA